MSILIVLIPLGLAMLGLALAAFIWAVSNGQFDDLEGEGGRILFEDDTPSVQKHSRHIEDRSDQNDLV